MNLKNKFRKFFTLSRRHEAGFTLVELIVVIAILAILGGVAVPVYSGYMKKANMTADRTLVSEVANALTMYYYSHPGEVTSAYVILDQEGKPVEVDNNANREDSIGAKALAAAFGDNWENSLGLKYDGWKGESSTLSYKNSSYFGKESDLISVVDSLTSALGEVVEKDKNMGDTLIGGEFETFLKDNKVNTDDGKAVGNAAVLYVANKTQGNEDAIKNAFAAGITASNGNAGAAVNNVYAELYKTGIGEAASLAAIYAYAEGYAQATGTADAFHAHTDFSAVTNTNSALTALGNAFSVLDPNGFADYVANQGNKDLKGYIDMMGTIHDNSNIVSGNLNSADCFTDGTVENMLKGFAAMSEYIGKATRDGQIAVVLVVDENGAVMTHVLPLNWNK